MEAPLLPTSRPPNKPSLPTSSRYPDAPSIPSSAPSNRPPQKVAIPRLPIPRRTSKGGSTATIDPAPGSPGLDAQRNRVSHACEPCRQRKTKCSGERPFCKHCQDFKLKCLYGDGKRDRAKNEMADLRARVDIYESLLNQLRGQIDSAGQLAISKALQGLRTTESPDGRWSSEHRDGESLVLADVASTGSIDHIVEEIDTEKTPYPIGYIGKSSEVSWIQRVAQQLSNEARKKSPQLPGEVDDEYQFETPAYHLDDISLSVSGAHIDPFLLPDRLVADELINVFFSTIHPTFPILQRKVFMAQYDSFFRMWFPPNNSKRWLSMLNLIFAIGSFYGKLVNAEWKGGDKDHLKYFGRARILSLDEGGLFEIADIQQVQVVALTGIYLLASNQTNRAWNIIGLAIRYAQTLGLYLRNDVPELSEADKELRVRIWWALYSLEHRLCLMTGRPSAIRDQDCSVPLPRPIDEDFCGIETFEDSLRNYDNSSQPGFSDESTPSSEPFSNSFTMSGNTTQTSMTSGPSSRSPLPPTPRVQQYTQNSNNAVLLSPSALYFYHHIKLTRITSEVFSSLYSPSTVNRTWSDLQGIISSLELKIQRWRNELPPSLSLDRPEMTRHRTALAFQYHHARILINRPCLRRLDLRIPNESARSRNFNRTGATTCISAAREMVALIPETPSPTALLSIAPWWGLLHYLVAAAAILLVEISMRAEHNPQQAEGLLSDIKKVIRWLRSVSTDSIAAERSWAVLVKLLIICAPKIGGDTSDVDRDLPMMSRNPPSAQPGPLHTATTDIHPYLFRQLLDETPGMTFFDPSPAAPQESPRFPMESMPIPLQQSSNSPHLLSSRTPSMHSTMPFHPQLPILPSPSSSSNMMPIPPSASSLPMNPSAMQLQGHPQMPLNLTPRLTDGSEHHLPARAQKRLSLGVGNIQLPPPPDLAPLWSSRAGDEAKSAEYLAHARSSVDADGGGATSKGSKRDRPYQPSNDVVQ